MGTIKEAQKVTLFAGIIAESTSMVETALRELSERYGEVKVKSPLIDFSFTDYYEPEMGRGLVRQWVGFGRQICPSGLALIKIATNEIEDRYSVSGKRKVNIDPGYLTPAKVVLASSKDFSHRIYLSGGIYAEVTLIYRHKEFISLEWTYPDYKSGTAIEFFKELRATSSGK